MEIKLNKATVQLNSFREQVKNTRDMLAAERTTKEKMHTNFIAQLGAANRKIGKKFYGNLSFSHTEVFTYVFAEELAPKVAELESVKSAKESALAAKAETERKSREFINEQSGVIDKLKVEKVCLCHEVKGK